MAEESTVKKVISTKVTGALKDKLVQEAKKEGLSTSEYIAKFLAIDWEKKENQYKVKVEKLTEELEVKDKLVQSLSERLEQEQILLGQQQNLQLMAQQQVVELQRNQKLLVEKTSSKKFWQIWK